MTEQESFIKKLSILLEEKNITQRELAEKINVTEVTISRYLSGERSPRIEIVSKIAEFFGVSIDYLLGKEETTNINTEDERLMAFYQGYTDLTEADKDVLMATFDAFIKARKGDK